MLHTMNLWHAPFTAIQSGQKDVELRLHDEKRQKILPGDQIEFTDADTGATMTVTVKAKRVFDNFTQLYAAYDKVRMGYKPEETADPRDMDVYYPAEKQKHYVVVAIEIEFRK